MCKRYFVYIVECKDGTYYTGYTVDIQHRMQVHNAGKGAKYTKYRRPVKLVYQTECDSLSEALKLEYAIKQLPRKDKEKLINEH